MNRNGPLVLGVGNPHRGDDDAGLRVVEALAARAPEGVDVRAKTGESLALVEAWSGREFVVVVDAVRTGNAPGTVVRVEIGRDPLPRSASTGSTHALGIADTVELARVLGRLPDRMVLWGITGTRFGMGQDASPSVIAAVPGVIDGILEDLRVARTGERTAPEGRFPCTNDG